MAYSKAENNDTSIMVNIFRGKETYMVLAENISKNIGPKIRLFPDDKIYFSKINYRQETVLVGWRDWCSKVGFYFRKK